MALTTEKKLDLMYQILRKEKLDGERLSKFTTDASRWIGQLVADLGLSYSEVEDLAQPIIARIIYDLAENWGLMDALREDFVAEQEKKKLAEKQS